MWNYERRIQMKPKIKRKEMHAIRSQEKASSEWHFGKRKTNKRKR